MNPMYTDVTYPRYSNPLGSLLDQIAFFLLYPWASILSTVIAFYVGSVEPRSWFKKLVERLVFGPVLIVFFFGLSFFGITGFCLWIFVCTFFSQKKYSYLRLNNRPDNDKTLSKQVFTLVSANVLLGNELFCRLNNMTGPLSRSKTIGKCLLEQSSDFLKNLILHPPLKEDAVIPKLPDVDILCLQEVWERYWGAALIDQLRHKYSYFVHDVGDFSLRSNFCLFGSGLFVASKYPIEAIHFQPFQSRINYAKSFSYGVLCLKVRVDGHRVAYVYNLHGQAYQGKEKILYHQMSETLDAVNSFRCKTQQLVSDWVIFDAICGDFNFDNMSPGDRPTQNHPLFNQYRDICAKKAGLDEPWAIGTELRQRRMHETSVTTADGFRRILLDDVKRRYHILDADVVEHTMALASIDPAPNDRGEIVAEEWGGKRRIDRILLRRDSPARSVGYAFSTVLSGLTDHLAVCTSLKVDPVNAM